jgi:3-hydroxyacyl-CoA dehydrogenase
MSERSLAIIGAGKMGHAIEQLAGERGWTVTTMVDVSGNVKGSGITRQSLKGAQVAVEFTEPSGTRGSRWSVERRAGPWTTKCDAPSRKVAARSSTLPTSR